MLAFRQCLVHIMYNSEHREQWRSHCERSELYSNMCIKEVKKFQFKSYIWTVFLCTVLLLSWGQPFCSAIFLQNFHFSIFYYLIKRTDDLISVKRVSSYRSAFTVHRKLRFILYKLILYYIPVYRRKRIFDWTTAPECQLIF